MFFARRFHHTFFPSTEANFRIFCLQFFFASTFSIRNNNIANILLFSPLKSVLAFARSVLANDCWVRAVATQIFTRRFARVSLFNIHKNEFYEAENRHKNNTKNRWFGKKKVTQPKRNRQNARNFGWKKFTLVDLGAWEFHEKRLIFVSWNRFLLNLLFFFHSRIESE